MYANSITKSMQAAIDEVNRRRTIQLAYNKSHHITPESIIKPIRQRLVEAEAKEGTEEASIKNATELASLTPADKKKYLTDLTRAMRRASRDLDFENAAKLRDLIRSLDSGKQGV